MADACGRGSNETEPQETSGWGEREGALMAKRATNAQRAEREDERRITEFMAKALAIIISDRGHVQPGTAELIHRAKLFKGKVLLAIYPKKGSKDTVRISPVHAATVPADTRHLLKQKPESTHLREAYAVVGRELCEFKGNVPEFLRLIADKIEGKRSYSPGEDWYDGAILKAYLTACSLSAMKHMDAVSINVQVPPSFSEFWDIFQQQNPKSKLLSEHADREERNSLQRKGYMCYTERSLRRSLRRLGCPIRSVKPGPKEKHSPKKENSEFVIRYVSPEVFSRLLRGGTWRFVQSSRRKTWKPREK
jgi:hypothetical protein